jgi:sulfur-oxidizing protein SoxY
MRGTARFTADKKAPDGEGRGMTNRRNLMRGLAAIAAGTNCWGPAAAQGLPPDIQAVVKTLLGDATPIGGRISLDLPQIAENGNTVPYTVRVESPMTDADYVKAVHLLAPANPLPQIGSFFFTPQSGKATVSSRMRLAQTQEVLVFAQMSDGTVYAAKRSVKVTVGGCGG